MNLTRQELADQAASLAVQGVYIGTSSWKYPGWCGMLYDRARYEYRGKFAETRFKRDCLAEYAEVFKTVCVDAAYYTFPSQQYLEGMVNQTPDDFLFGLKVTDAITIKKFPKLDRFGEQAGQAERELPQRRPVCEGVPEALRGRPRQHWPADVRVLPVLADRLRAWPGLHRRPRQVPGPVANRLAVWRGDAEPELAEAGVLRVPRPAPGRARLQLVGCDAAQSASRWRCRAAGPTPNWSLPGSCSSRAASTSRR